MVKFDVTKEEMEVIEAIARRAVASGLAPGFRGMSEIMMDVTAVHANGCPLKLRELLGADASNFGHDILGIRRHLDRQTGELKDFFLPRFSR